MPDVLTGAMGAVSAVTGILGRNSQNQAAAQASDAQKESSQQSIAESRRQFDAIQELFKPYIAAGTQGIQGLQPFGEAGAPALAQQQAILGLSGPDAQAQAISGIESSPLYQAQVRQGENALLQNASATGGLRGGNVQAALAQFRPQMLQNQIDLQYNRLGGLTDLGSGTFTNLAQLGQASAAGQGTAGLKTAESVNKQYADIGTAQASRALAEQKAQSQFQQGISGIVGQGIQGLGSLFSDIRLKQNIKKVGTRPDGLNVYEYEYIWGGGRHLGLMAQEVNAVYPHAVGVVDGYLTVNYSQV